jgi:transketolase
VLDRSKYAAATNAVKGAYVVAYGDELSQQCDVLLIATGSEVSIALQAREVLAEKNVKARVISIPCFEWFFEQSPAYQEEVMPRKIKARVSIEAGVSQPWYKIIGDYGIAISLEHFGASASASVLFKEFGFTAENVVAAATESIKRANG